MDNAGELVPVSDGSLLLVLPLQYRRVDGQVHIDKQAANGLSLWADHFSRLTVACPVRPSAVTAADDHALVPVSTIRGIERITFCDLPWAYRPGEFLRAYRPTAALLASQIDSHQYLSFALGGLIGDWGTVASFVAAKRGRKYSVWTDRVEHEVIRRVASTESFKRRIRSTALWRPMRLAHRRAIRASALGLFHGRDCFDAYRPWCREPHLVHNIHTKASDRLSADQLAVKQASVLESRPLRIVYAGRAAAMKGSFDWVATLAAAAKLGVAFQAQWLGVGPDLDAMKSAAAAAGIADRITFAGFVDDRQLVLGALRAADLLLFCHKTPESPRVLIESLISAAPLIGYDSLYARDLIATHQGGRLVPIHQTQPLAELLATLDRDRASLSDLVHRAWLDAEPFNDAAVFAHRSELIKQFS